MKVDDNGTVDHHLGSAERSRTNQITKPKVGKNEAGPARELVKSCRLRRLSFCVEFRLKKSALLPFSVSYIRVLFLR